MREIKFRAWNPQKKIMKQVGALDWNEKYNVVTCNLYSDKWYRGFVKEFDFILMQYTGLKDNNGKEIYEGDIVVGYDDGGEGECGVEYLSIIIWDTETCGFKFKDLEYKELYPMNDYCFERVIGNIFENTELIEGDE